MGSICRCLLWEAEGKGTEGRQQGRVEGKGGGRGLRARRQVCGPSHSPLTCRPKQVLEAPVLRGRGLETLISAVS